MAAGQIAGFELGQAQGMPGVLAIITPGQRAQARHQ